jgi:hypothetical protein
MAHDVFISYSSHDKAVADAVCASLESRRIRCWIAPRDVLPGVAYAEALIDGLNQSRLMVLVFSNNSNTSPQVIREVERAVNKGIPIIPFRIENVVPSKAMEYFVSSSHWLDALTPPLEMHLQRLADTVQVLLSGSDTTLAGTMQPPMTAAEVKPKAKNRALPLFILGGAIVIALAVIGVIFLTGGFGRRPLGPGSSTPPSSQAANPASPSTKPPSASATAQRAKGLLFEDDFSSPSTGWKRLSDENSDSNYANGEYSITLKKSNWQTWRVNTEAGRFADMTLDIDARLVSGLFQNGYGVLFRVQDDNNFYRFLISGQGEFRIDKRVDGNVHILQKYTRSPIINQGNLTNHLKIVCRSRKTDLECNGHPLYSFSDDSFSEGFIGVAVSTALTAMDPTTTVNFDNLKIYAGN